MIRTILLPLLESDDGRSMALAADLCRHFRSHLEVVCVPEGRPMAETSFHEWRLTQGLRPERRRGLPSASLSQIVEAHGLESRARLADLICVVPPPAGEPVEGLIERLIFECGRPVLVVPMAGPYLPNSFLGARTVVGWNATAEAVRATSAALPFLEVSASVEVLTLDEEAYAAADAYEIVGHLSAHGIQATAAGIGRKNWIGSDVIEIARGRDPGLFVMGARRQAGSLGSATRRFLGSRPFPVLMMA